MKCCYCGNEENKVTDSRYIDEQNAIRRRRECLNCGRRFTTYEQIEKTPLLVVKKNGDREPFRLEKIKLGMIKSCEKRPVSMGQIDQIVDDITMTLSNSLDQEIPSQKLGELVMDKLKKIDEVSYIRFACVYRKFAFGKLPQF